MAVVSAVATNHGRAARSLRSVRFARALMDWRIPLRAVGCLDQRRATPSAEPSALQSALCLDRPRPMVTQCCCACGWRLPHSSRRVRQSGAARHCVPMSLSARHAVGWEMRHRRYPSAVLHASPSTTRRAPCARPRPSPHRCASLSVRDRSRAPCSGFSKGRAQRGGGAAPLPLFLLRHEHRDRRALRRSRLGRTRWRCVGCRGWEDHRGGRRLPIERACVVQRRTSPQRLGEHDIGTARCGCGLHMRPARLAALCSASEDTASGGQQGGTMAKAASASLARVTPIAQPQHGRSTTESATLAIPASALVNSNGTGDWAQRIMPRGIRARAVDRTDRR